MFTFRFEALLTSRRHAEEMLQRELSEARRALAAEQAALREKKNAHRQCLQELNRRQKGRFRAADIMLYRPYLERLEHGIKAQQKQLTQAERKVAQKRQALVEAMKKRKILEKIKEKDHQAYQAAENRRERRFIDEVAGRRHLSKKHPQADAF